MLAVEARDLRKTFVSNSSVLGRIRNRKIVVEALRGINLKIKDGQIYGLLGPNGAGKTTFINILSTLLSPTSGKAKVLGFDVLNDDEEIRKRIGVCYGNSRFSWNLNTYENLEYYGMLHGMKNDERKENIKGLVELLDMKEFADMKFVALSTGMKQKIAIAKSLLNNPQLVFMDEPTLGLDVEVAAEVRDILKKLVRGNGMTIVLTSHNMFEIENMCKNIALINKGKIVKEGSVEKIRGRKSLEHAFLEIVGGKNV